MFAPHANEWWVVHWVENKNRKPMYSIKKTRSNPKFEEKMHAFGEKKLLKTDY